MADCCELDLDDIIRKKIQLNARKTAHSNRAGFAVELRGAKKDGTDGTVLFAAQSWISGSRSLFRKKLSSESSGG